MMKLLFVCAVFLSMILFDSCGGLYNVKRAVVQPDNSGTLDKNSPYLKVHMQNGDVYLLRNWTYPKSATFVTGTGELRDASRALVTKGDFMVPRDSIVLLETNVVESSGTLVYMTIFTGISAALTVFCITNPKTCFGSCPTFYLENEDQRYPEAEGFSSSVAPSLERRDIDMLYHAKTSGSGFVLRMRNEALETHMVRRADLLLVPRLKGGRVYATPDGHFFQTGGNVQVSRVKDDAANSLELLRSVDGKERFSLSDSLDLTAKEEIELEFDCVPHGEVGLVVGARQTLMSTYIFYQSLAYLGTQAGEFFASLERGKKDAHGFLEASEELMGGISVSVKENDNTWIPVGDIRETGPIAVDFHLIKFPGKKGGHRTVRLAMTKGYWRLDYAALVQVGSEITPTRIRPTAVYHHREEDGRALSELLDDSKLLVTYPGDEYAIHYTLPQDDQDYELFLDSQGYYLEWMRQEWLAEENLPRAYQMLNDPQRALRAMAPAFKVQEPAMESQFWRSRYANH